MASRNESRAAVATSLLALGQMYERKKVRPEPKECSRSVAMPACVQLRARSMYQKSASLGNAESMFAVATLHGGGLLGVEHDIVQAVTQYHFAAISGSQSGQMALGSVVLGL